MHMKKYIYILTAALLATACVRGLDPVQGPDSEPADGPKVTVEFSVPMPAQTKAGMGHDPEIETIHVAVFNRSGILKEFAPATLTNAASVVNGDGTGTYTAQYTVDLTMSASPRILHFIGNSPVTSYADLTTTTGEDNVMQSLITKDGAVAYWQRFELDKIDAYTYKGGVYTAPDGQTYGQPGGTKYQCEVPTGSGTKTVWVNVGDYIKRDGTKIVDDTGYFASDELSDALKLIPFIRNFAEITVTSTEDSNFTITEIGIGNTVNAGFVAPYDVKQRRFAPVYTRAKGPLSHSAIVEDGYAGSLPAEATIKRTLPETEAFTGSWTTWLYERPKSSKNSTSLLIGGTFKNGEATGTRYFKIELTDPNGAYFPIYRGVAYNIQIGKITGSTGKTSKSKAWSSPAIGDVSSSAETRTLEQISDGRGTTLWVEYIDYISTDGKESETDHIYADIYYTMYYLPAPTEDVPEPDPEYLWDDLDLTVTHSQNPAIVEVPGTEPGGEPVPAITIADGTFTTGTPDASKEWKKATVELNGSGDINLKSTLTVMGLSHEEKPMSRDVAYRVMGTQKFQDFSASNLPNQTIGQTTTLTIKIPADLGYSMFPLILKIEAQNGAFNSSEGLPVEYGPSLFGTDHNSFYFLKTIEYSEYYNAETEETKQEYTCTFKTTRTGTAADSNATTFAVIDKVHAGRTAPFFEQKTCTVSVGN